MLILGLSQIWAPFVSRAQITLRVQKENCGFDHLPFRVRGFRVQKLCLKAYGGHRP